jgi:hypothetical protein
MDGPTSPQLLKSRERQMRCMSPRGEKFKCRLIFLKGTYGNVCEAVIAETTGGVFRLINKSIKTFCNFSDSGPLS